MIGNHFNLSDKVAIITGASEGMGKASAELFAACGAKLVVTARTPAKIDAVARDLNDSYGNGKEIAMALPGDLADKPHLQALVDMAVARFGRLNTVLCSPAIEPWLGPSIETSDDVFDKQLLYILKSRFWLSSMAIPHMIADGGGSLIYIGSGSVFEATTERSVNAIARAGEWQMMKNFAAEFGRNNIRANTIAPGMIESSGSKALFASKEGARRIASLPLRRGGKVKEIAMAAAFLASDASSFTTGAVLPVDGGRLLHAVDGMLTSAYADKTD